MNSVINRMLEEAYSRLHAPNQRQFCREAVEYLLTDRDHYIQLANPDTPEYEITVRMGMICRMVPLAIRLSEESHKNAVCHKSEVVHLVVTPDKAEYAIETASRWEYTDPEKEDSYRYPVYRRTSLEDLGKGFMPLLPQQITPCATKRRREIFGMMFMAIAKFSGKYHINTIPARTEQAMFYSLLAPDTQLSVDGKAYTGKWIPLAKENSLYETYREDHRYSWRRELGLMITPLTQFYVLKTHHVYRYFRKIIYDKDIPGACSYEDTGEKQESTYEKVELDQVQGDMYPNFQ